MLGNQLGFINIPKAQAQSKAVTGPVITPKVDTFANHSEIGLIAILVEDSLLDDGALKSRIFDYAKNAQNRMPHSQAMVMGIKKDESTFNVAKVLEKLYYEGIDDDLLDQNPFNNDAIREDDNKLIGVVLVGDVPIPVVQEGKMSFPSLYPYTDFYRKRYIYNHETDKFELNNDIASPNPEIWHGVIVPPDKNKRTARQQLIDFFDKNEKYSEGDEEYANFEKRMLYANFPAMEQQANFMDYKNYQRYGKYMEETAFNRYNKHLLKELINEVSADMGSDTPIISAETLDTMLDVSTEFIFNQYLAPFSVALKIYRGKLNDMMETTGRWASNQVDTPDSLISMRDAYAKATLIQKQMELEKEVDDLIESEIPEEERVIELLADVDLKIKTDIPVLGTGTKTFTFYGFIDGKPVSIIETTDECDIYVGQKRGRDQSVMENNSVYVEANRLYDPESMIEPPDDDDDWELEEEQDYIDYAGCVFNNSMEIQEGDLDLSPDKCIKEDAILPLFSIIGSRETNETGGCNLENTSFGPFSDTEFESDAKSGGLSSVKLKSVINKVYSKLRDSGVITKSASTLRGKASLVIHALIKTGETVKYEPNIPIGEVELSIWAEKGSTKEIEFFEKHVEPTKETLIEIKQLSEETCGPDGSINFPQIVTPSTPADGIRYIQFGDESEQKYEYLNFYRVEGGTPDEIENNLSELIEKKEEELGTAIDGETDVISEFFEDNSDVKEPMVWKTLGTDQKLESIIPKYLDKDSVMPSPIYLTHRSPQNKPNGYEVLHIVADGDAWGYQFGLNRAMMLQNQGSGIGEEGAEEEGEGEEEGEEEDGGGGEDEGSYLCGDPSGVEIWEWFEALQCWIENEILPAAELFKLDESCGALAPGPEEEEEEEFLPDPITDTTFDPVSIKVDMGLRSFVAGQDETIRLYPLNSEEESIMGYIDDVVHLELVNPAIGEFSKNDFHFFKGDEEVKFTAKQMGSTQLKITMGSIETAPITINVYNSINVHFESEQQSGGQVSYKVEVDLRDPSNNILNDINTDLIVSPSKPTDGGFENNGKVEITDGKGEIVFVPMAGVPKIDLIEKDPYYTGEPHTIYPPPNPPVKLVIKPIRYVKVGATDELLVTAVDVFDKVAEFDKEIEITLSEDTGEYATVLNPNIKLNNGKGKIKLQAGKETGEISLIASHPNLTSAEINLPILARVESEEWNEAYTQNLFASFVGFPAGNVLEEDYFGGTHLFNGKTEAVFSFLTGPTPPPVLTVSPNNKITLTEPQQIVYVELPTNKLLLEAFDRKKLQTLLSKTIPLNFSKVALWDEEIGLEENAMYLDITGNNYETEEIEKGFVLSNALGEKILKIKNNNIHIINPEYKLAYNPNPEFDTMELLLTDEFEEIARLILNFKNESIDANDFDEINEMYVTQKIYSGKGTNEANGIVLYNPIAPVQKEERGEYYGFEGDNKYIQLFAGGTPIGEATRFNLPANGILLGDPTIQLDVSPSGGLNYDYSKGRKIFQDPQSTQIVSINSFDFNNDVYEDVVLVMQDGRVRLMEGGPTEPILRDRGDIAYLADGAIAVEIFDFENDGYEDLVIGTHGGRLGIFHNNKEEITRTDQEIEFGKKLYSMIKGDMDADGNEDLVVLDSRGDVLIFYQEDGKFRKTGKLLGNYGFSLKLGKNLQKDIDVRYPGLSTPLTGFGNTNTSALPSADLSDPVVEPSDSKLKALQDMIDGNVNNPSEDASKKMFEAAATLAEVAREDPTGAALQSSGPPLLPWPEGYKYETYFAPVENTDFLTIKKTVRNKERPEAKNIDLEEKLIYQIDITSSINKSNVVFADTVPDALSVDTTTAQCAGAGCSEMKTEQKSIRLFFSGLDLKANQTISIMYEADVEHTPQSQIFVQKLREPSFLSDEYLDVVVSPPYNTTGDFIQHYSTGPRNYSVRSTTEDVRPLNAKSQAMADALAENMAFIGELEEFADQEFSEDYPPENPPAPEGACEAVGEAMGVDCFAEADSLIDCAGAALDDIAEAINDFACMGGGCFPIPWNTAFLVPGGYTLALPVYAFPTTLTTPVGPMPCRWPPMPLGMTNNFPGPIMSMLRYYASPTLTGGLGMAMCWGPYMGDAVPPPPVFPIPYPPPIGNCMVIALPTWTKVCDIIEEGMDKLMEWINTGINKINSAATSVNNNESIPANFTQGGGSEEGAGGLEISLGVNLGEANTFEPPAKGFSNIHIPTFDSLMGKISDWVDRQTLEIINKLLRFPTFYVYLPNFRNLFSLDFEVTEKAAETWFEQLSKSGEATGQTLSAIKGKKEQEQTEEQAAEEEDVEYVEMVNSYGNDSEVIGTNKKESRDPSKILKYMETVEAQFNIYNLDVFQGLYDVASTLPLVKLTEQPIDFKIPWLSAAEIQAFIMELQKARIYYEREWDRVKDKWESIQCPDIENNDPTESAEVKRAKCLGRHMADMFAVDLEDFLESIQENIEVLQSYLTFPRKFVKFRAQLVDYIRGVACYFDVIAQMMGGWMATIHEQLVSWAELILTIYEIFQNWKKLFDIFINFDASCSICTNERWANFGWWMLLGLIIPDIPIISFPKWPDVVFDVSNISGAINIEIPMLHITPEPIPLPPIPYIRLPDFPHISMSLSLPPLPILPRLPDLPDLPDLPPLPVVELPTLPSPPKLPDLGKPFKIIIPLVEKILKIWCMMKKAFAPVPESMLNDQITLLTNRPGYLIPLDILKLQLPNIALFDLGFNELRIETTVYLGLRIQLISKAMESAADTWNDWIEAIPEAMNEFYQEWIIDKENMIQDKIDEFEELMEKGAELLEEGCIEYDKETGVCTKTIQDVIDEKVGGAFEEAEKAMQDWVDEKAQEFEDWAEEHGLDPEEWNYDSYVNAITNANKRISNWSEGIADKIDNFFDEYGDYMTAIGYGIPFADKLDDVMEKYDDAGDLFQKNVLDNIGTGIEYSLGVGITGMDQVFDYMDACFHDKYECDNGDDYFGAVIPDLREDYANELISLVTELKTAISDINDAELVDYQKVKEDLGVEDFEMPPRKTTLDKIKWMQEELYAYSDKVEKEVEEMKNVKDLTAIAKVPPRHVFPYDLATAEYQPDVIAGEKRVYTNAIIPEEILNADKTVDKLNEEKIEMQEKLERQFQASGSSDDSSETNSSCAGMCLPDPITSAPTPFIPDIEFPLTSETLFLSSGHVVYSDGTSLYLKQDLNIPISDVNEGHNNHIIELRYMPYLMESVNMLQTTLTENGSSSFVWKPSTNKNLYGYGIELERSILGFDADEQGNQLADTKFVLLPLDEEGNVPEVLVNGEPIPYGTFVTSMEDADEAQNHFGVKFNNVITNADKAVFPTINNATITVNENVAFVYDKYAGSSYSVNMENGFYHIKMTWFDQRGLLATYNQNELLSPQIYVDAAPPIDIAFDKIFYTPVFKEKTIQASNIFIDLAGTYEYHWYVDFERNPITPVTGETLVIPPQHNPKEFLVKLVASENIKDDSFERYEKIFKVVVYVPTIDLKEKPLQEGTVTGDLYSIGEVEQDDLSNIPFSLFRKRWNTWKNLGILIDKKEGHETTPPLNDHGERKYIYKDSYYTSASTQAEGEYNIIGLSKIDPSPIVIKDANGDEIIRIIPGTGRIEILKEGYSLRALPAAVNLPTRIAIIEDGTAEGNAIDPEGSGPEQSDLIVGNVYYVPDSNTDITILEEPVTMENIMPIGVTVGDANPEDDIIAKNIPGSAESYPGGIAIYNQTPPQKNVAVIDTDGSIRMMQKDYKLKIKNEETMEEPYIFQIVTEEDEPIFDVYIQANLENINIKDEVMGESGIQIGLIEKPERAFAALLAQTDDEKNSITNQKSEITNNVFPFPDLDSAHPFFSEILRLYEARIISGYGDGTFKPDEKLTRAEFIKIALGVTNCYDCQTPTDAQRKKYTPSVPFPDVSLPAWYYFCIWIAKDLEMITGYGDGFFRPSRNISRAEAAAVLLRQSHIEISETPPEAFADVPDYAWYKDYVYTAVEIGLIKESGGFVFPDEEITRGEFAFMGSGVMDMYDCHEVDEDEDGIPDWWEMENNMDPLFANDAPTDVDFDGLTALEEYQLGTDPNNADSDGDGLSDKEDPEPLLPEGICPCVDNPNQNDTDGDGIIDACDTDIDNDGVSNMICLFDDEGKIDQAKVDASADNCIFTENTDQIDDDKNHIGNACEICPCIDNPNQNDTDGDGIIDACDTDIDNDGVFNVICLFDDDGIVDKEKVAQSDDNCIFIENLDQVDSDFNIVGDKCEPFDLCPPVPEDMDGVNDEDGCPEVDDDFPDEEPGIYVTPGPACSFIDYESDMMEGDIFMTAITDVTTHENILEKSNEVTYEP